MRKIRILSILIFLLSVGVYGAFTVRHRGVEAAPPTITMDSDTIHVSVEDDQSRMLEGIQATSGKTDLQDSLVIENLSNFLEEGRRELTVAAVDKNDKVSKATRMVIYDDYRKARFQLTEPLNFRIATTDFLKNMTVDDCLDGDLSTKIKVTGDGKIQVDEPGDYSVVFTVANSAGDVTKLPATVTILDNSVAASGPEIILDDYLIYVEQGAKKVNGWKYLKEVKLRGRTYIPQRDPDNKVVLVEKSSVDDEDLFEEEEEDENKIIRDIKVTNPVDMDEPGVYEILFTVNVGESDERLTGVTRLIVIVEGEE